MVPRLGVCIVEGQIASHKLAVVAAATCGRDTLFGLSITTIISYCTTEICIWSE